MGPARPARPTHARMLHVCGCNIPVCTLLDPAQRLGEPSQQQHQQHHITPAPSHPPVTPCTPPTITRLFWDRTMQRSGKKSCLDRGRKAKERKESAAAAVNFDITAVKRREEKAAHCVSGR
mmetsp:Transcript_25635/g.65073  ORF Transcript_25635/g.65073 Transcript_25635/m.65073 type:complete len:121 (-) Transcript_25635:2464-2826(-)